MNSDHVDNQRIVKQDLPNSPITELLKSNGLRVINLGLNRFAETFKQQGVEFVQMDWRPPVEEDQDLLDILNLLGD